jgi:hypothetical protein
MNNLNLPELCQKDLLQINGGLDEEAYNIGYAAGATLGKMVRNFLTLSGFWRLVEII